MIRVTVWKSILLKRSLIIVMLKVHMEQLLDLLNIKVMKRLKMSEGFLHSRQILLKLVEMSDKT